MKQATNVMAKIGSVALATAAMASTVLAEVDDYSYTYDLGSSTDDAALGGVMAAMGGLWFVFVCCIVIFSLAFLVFNIMMILDVMKRTETEMPNKQTWMILLIVGLLLGFGPIVTLVYYFGPRKKLGPAKAK